MSFADRLAAYVKSKATKPTAEAPRQTGLRRRIMLPAGTRWFEPVGEAHYQQALARLAGGRKEDSANIETVATLVPEPTNPYDCNAVRVEVDGNLVAYMKRTHAERYCEILKAFDEAGYITQCEALICGGWDRGKEDMGHFGIKLKLAPPDVVAVCLPPNAPR